MKLDITNMSYDAKWYDMKTGKVVNQPGDEGVFIKIQPMPFSKSNVLIKQDAMLLAGEEQCRIFKESCQDWRGIVDANDQPLECSDDVKQKVFDFRMGGISDFVIGKVWEFDQAKAGQEKNS